MVESMIKTWKSTFIVRRSFDNTLYRWMSEYNECGESAFPDRGIALYSYQYEIKNLKRENIFIF